MTSKEIRQSFLDFFEEQGHTIVPSASLMPTSPNLLFTNAGMNQFVPYFLGSEKAPYDPPRAADTQKCIRAGGKHNDLEDVGFDTYHHTFFEMLGNWSFGDYFKKEAITWAWELLTGRWGIPKERLYATVYKPGEGDPAEFDQEAYDYWAKIYTDAGLDPKVHIVNGNKKDNFWMMGDTGPCGPCSEIHIDLTPNGDTKGTLVNGDDARCIEIWNLVFIQLNAEKDGSFRPLPAKHVDTGMGFERICAVLQGTRGLTDFGRLASNYDTDVFTPIFAAISKLCGKTYDGTVPKGGSRAGLSGQEEIDVAFRVIADHLRTVSFSIADGILPSNEGRNYVVRRILRRAIRMGRTLGLGDGGKPFLPQLAPTLIEQMSEAFPELESRRAKILEILEMEEESFNRTLDRGIKLFEEASADLKPGSAFPASTVVKLWETYGFPLDLTQMMLDERDLKVDQEELEALKEKHSQTGEAGHSTQDVSAVKIDTDVVSEFVGYDSDSVEATVERWVLDENGTYAIVDKSPLYVEKGGQVGDTGFATINGDTIPVRQSLSVGEALCLELESKPEKETDKIVISVEPERRRAIERHHTATHLFHWALHETVSRDATQQGSLVAPDRLRFDFNSKALDSEQLETIEKLVNDCVESNDPVSWVEVPHSEIQGKDDIMQFFGDKYGDNVRVVQIGGKPGQLDGYSMELCGGTHVRQTGDIKFFKIRSEGAIAAGIRRVEAVCGDTALEYLADTAAQLKKEASELEAKLNDANSRLKEVGQKPVVVDPLETDPAKVLSKADASSIDEVNAALRQLTQHREDLKNAVVEAEKRFKKASGSLQGQLADETLNGWMEEAEGGALPEKLVKIVEGDDPALLQEILNGLKKRQYPGVAVVVQVADGKVHLGALVHPGETKEFRAGDLIRELAPVVGGKGGGKPEMARGAGSEPDKVPDLLTKATELLGA